jgi:predicted pyridoxine 5'-phosphate oxidase superfamily flavin-nucleotide-binding protein
MGILTDDMKRVVREQRLGFAATVCPDGTPNVSPKGTTTVWDDTRLVFAHISSPGTVANLRHNPAIEINVVDPIVRKGYRFKGTATVLTVGPLYQEILAFYRGDFALEREIAERIQAIVLVTVERALPLISPAYDSGAREDEIKARWERYWEALRPARRKVKKGRVRGTLRASG